MGNRIKDLVTSIEGICTGELRYLNGCEKWMIETPPVNGTLQQYWIDKQQCRKIDEGVAAEMSQKETGGPTTIGRL